ncbi:MAG: hypothetical protein H7138_16790 [Myxococcales bacterium]|nr:hypothetical protein [Myxococcales bacterium]
MKKLLALSILFATTATIHAESLEERKYWKGQMDYINRGIDDGEKQCGVKFTFEFVEKPKLREEAEKNNNSPYGICDSIVQEVVSLCREGEDEKASVKAKIKGFQCGYGKPRKLDLGKSGIVKYMGNNEESNFSDWAKPWLMKKL